MIQSQNEYNCIKNTEDTKNYYFHTDHLKNNNNQSVDYFPGEQASRPNCQDFLTAPKANTFKKDQKSKPKSRHNFRRFEPEH